MLMNSNHVAFFDTTLRDGEQSPGCSMTTQEKLTMAHALEDLGVDIIEAGFAMASEGDFAAIATITQAIRKPRIASLARAKTEDIEMAARSFAVCRPRPHPCLPRHPATCISNTSSRSAASRLSTQTGESVRLARTLVDDVEFSPEDATRSDRDFLVEMVRIAVEAGATTINMPDTVGYTTPEEYGADVPRGPRAHSRHRRQGHHPLLALPRRPRPRRRQLLAAISAARARWSAPSTASANAPATPPSKRLPRPLRPRRPLRRHHRHQA
jgi:isopropylmalate/homocitrate/citramalate synthase